MVRGYVPETNRILFLGDDGSLSGSAFLNELLSGRTFIRSGPRLIQFIKFRIASGTNESLLTELEHNIERQFCQNGFKYRLFSPVDLFMFEIAKVMIKVRNNMKWFAFWSWSRFFDLTTRPNTTTLVLISQLSDTPACHHWKAQDRYQ